RPGPRRAPRRDRAGDRQRRVRRSAAVTAAPARDLLQWMQPAMAIRKIAQIGHPVLRQVAREVGRDELARPDTQRFIDDLIETMHDADGAGLAAIQVYEPIQICAIEVRNNPRYPYKPPMPLTVLVNPVLTPVGEEQFDNYEG